MILTKILLANILIFIANLIFILSLFPQILLNYKIRSTKGLSDLFILASLNGQFSYLIYSFIKDLPFIYKIINPIYAFLFSIIIFQRFYYSDGSSKDKFILRFYIINLFILIYLSYLIFNGLTTLGSLLGWIPLGIGLWKKVPQILKVYKTKSVYGFSLFCIILSLISYMFEASAGFMLDLPVPVLLNDLRGFFINFLFLFQFWTYK
ncbi:MAG: PQ-loop repeat-containing protein [bacterium]